MFTFMSEISSALKQYLGCFLFNLSAVHMSNQSIKEWNAQVFRTGSSQISEWPCPWIGAAQFSNSDQPKLRNLENCGRKTHVQLLKISTSTEIKFSSRATDSTFQNNLSLQADCWAVYLLDCPRYIDAANPILNTCIHFFWIVKMLFF